MKLEREIRAHRDISIYINISIHIYICQKLYFDTIILHDESRLSDISHPGAFESAHALRSFSRARRNRRKDQSATTSCRAVLTGAVRFSRHEIQSKRKEKKEKIRNRKNIKHIRDKPQCPSPAQAKYQYSNYSLFIM